MDLKARDMEEIWKEIPGTDGHYLVSNLGRVWVKERKVPIVVGGVESERTIKERIHKGTKRPFKSGIFYMQTTIRYKNEVIFAGHVHQLVAIYFLGHVPSGHKTVVDHINHDGTDNRVCNLRLVTSRQNICHTKKVGSSKLQGVSIRSNGKIVSQISPVGQREKRYHLGYFNSEEEAYFHYIKALSLFNWGLIRPSEHPRDAIKRVYNNG